MVVAPRHQFYLSRKCSTYGISGMKFVHAAFSSFKACSQKQTVCSVAAGELKEAAEIDLPAVVTDFVFLCRPNVWREALAYSRDVHALNPDIRIVDLEVVRHGSYFSSV